MCVPDACRSCAHSASRSQLPPAPDALEADAAAAAAAQEAARAAALAQDQASVRQLRMALRGVVVKLLGDRRWAACAMPVDPEEDPEENPDFSCLTGAT